MWLGRADPVAATKLARENDPERAALNAMLLAWSAALGLGCRFRCTLQNVIEAAGEAEGKTWPELYAAVQNTVRGRGPVNATGLGIWTRQNKGRIVDGLSLACKPNPKGGALWWVEDRKGTEKEPAQTEMALPDMGHCAPGNDPPGVVICERHGGITCHFQG
jgi:hypothetical protein